MSTLTETKNLNVILDVKVDLTVRIGSCMLPMRDVVELSEGPVLQLDQLASEPVGLYVNDKLIARGEVVVVEENFGIKITQIVGEPACGFRRGGSPSWRPSRVSLHSRSKPQRPSAHRSPHKRPMPYRIAPIRLLLLLQAPLQAPLQAAPPRPTSMPWDACWAISPYSPPSRARRFIS